MAQHRETFRTLAGIRLAEARLLLQGRQPSGAYYLAGYAIECALKARIAAEFRDNEIPDWRRVRDIYTHGIARLMSLASLMDLLEADMRNAPKLSKNWTTLAGWSEQARYQVWSMADASEMLQAVDGDGGLLPWLQNHW